MAMNDVYIYCMVDQIKEEFLVVMDLYKEFYEILGIEDFYMCFFIWDLDDFKGKDKYFDDFEGWAFFQRIVEEVMKESGLFYVEGKGEVVFYGFKVDFQFWIVIGCEEIVFTNQLDFGIVVWMDLNYIDVNDML